MTCAAAVFCCLVALAFVQGFGSPAFVSVIASDAIGATLPFLGFLVVARFVAMRKPDHARTVVRVHLVAQGMLVAMAFGWWWVEPHAALASLTSGSLTSMAWQAAAGGVAGLLVALLAERVGNPVVFREIWLAVGVVFLIGGGRIYRAFDHVEAGVRLGAASAIVSAAVMLGVAGYFLLRNRPRVATAIPALAPPLACLALLFALYGGGPKAPASGDSILLVLVDTLRADIADGGFVEAAAKAEPAGSTVVGAGVGTAASDDKATTAEGAPTAPARVMASNGIALDGSAMPQLARIAEAGVRFSQAVSPAPWTLPATVSLLSGWNPHRHRFGVSASDWEVLPGDPAALYLPKALRDAGYLTAAFVNNPYLRPYYGFGSGFYTMRPYHGHAIDGIALALDWLREHMGAPSFTMLHLMDPHWPYDAPPGYGPPREDCAECDSLVQVQYVGVTEAHREEIRRRYAAEVRYTDFMLGRLYDTLAAAGALEHTWLIITADHGEEFWEHGKFLHGHSLYDELLRVPLVVVPPRADSRTGRRESEQVRLEDVGATMVEIAGLSKDLALDGRSLLPVLQRSAESDAEEEVRVSIGGFVKSPIDFTYSVRRPPWKAMVSPTLFGMQLFSLAKDGREQNNLLFRKDLAPLMHLVLSREFNSLAAEPKRLGLSVARSTVESSGAAPDADTQRSLRSLGYAE